jgi:hypothetical protein
MEQHARLVRWFEEAERSSQNEREQAERDRDYYDGAQLTPGELAALKKRGQPPLIDNYIRDKVDLLCGMERKARTDPVAYPRTPQEEDRADAATQALRYLQDDLVLPQIRSSVWENMLIEGIGGAELGLEDDGKGGANITLTHVAWDRLFRDPHSRTADCSDSRYHGIVAWMDRDQLEEMYPNAGDVLEEAFAPRGRAAPMATGPAWWPGRTARASAAGWCRSTGKRVPTGGARPSPKPASWLSRGARRSRTARGARPARCGCARPTSTATMSATAWCATW